MTSGTFNIDLSAVTSAVEVKLGKGTNTVISGVGNDVITLTTSAGSDTVSYKASGQGTDNIVRFQAGASGDIIALNGTGFAVMGASASTAGVAADLFVVTAAAATGAMTAADNMIVLASAFANTASMIAAIVDGGTQEIGLAATATTGMGYLIAWTDGNDTYVSLLNVSGATGLNLTTGSIETLTVLSGVTPGALVAANFDFV
jgi:hypothetical protein